MPVYTYTALNERGKATKGIINADSSRAARAKLRQSRLFPTELIETEKADAHERSRGSRDFSLWRRVRPQDITIMTRQLATLMAASLTVVDSLTALIEQTENATLKKTLIQVRERVNEGSSLANALDEHHRVFSTLFINMVRAGEASGALPLILLRLADFSERRLDTQKKITSKLYTPILTFALSGFILLALLTYVVPTVTAIFEDMDQTLPLPTRILIGVSDFLQNFWWLLALVIVGIVVALQRFRSTKRGAKFFDTWAIRAPIFGRINLKAAVARFTRTLGILLQSGLPLLDALEIARAVFNNTVLAASADTAKELIREGSDIAGPLRDSGYFPPLVSHMISIGERTGQLEDMLIRIADAYDSEVQTSLEGLTSLVEPLIVIMLGVVALGIALSILLPIFEINTMIR